MGVIVICIVCSMQFLERREMSAFEKMLDQYNRLHTPFEQMILCVTRSVYYV